MMLPGERLWLNSTRWSEKPLPQRGKCARAFPRSQALRSHSWLLVQVCWADSLKSKLAGRSGYLIFTQQGLRKPQGWSPTGVRGEATQPWLRLHKLSGQSRELSFTSRSLEFPGKLGPCIFFQSFGCWACPGLNIPVGKWGMRAYQQAIGHQLCLGGLMAATFGHHWQGNCLMNVIRRLSRDNNG